MPDSHTPLTREEWRRFLEEKPSNFSLGRWVAILADTVGGKIPVTDAVRGRLAGCEMLWGLEILADLEALGLEIGQRKVADLAPPVKPIRLNRQGRLLKLTPSLVLQSTLGFASPLGDPRKLSAYLREGRWEPFFRRLRSDLKALWRLYEYGCLHNYVRVCWGFFERDPPRGVEPRRPPASVRSLRQGSQER